jgi:hypothetical protein
MEVSPDDSGNVVVKISRRLSKKQTIVILPDYTAQQPRKQPSSYSPP